MNNQPENSQAQKREYERKRARKEPAIRIFLYIGAMSFASLGYISREDLSGLYKLIAICFAISTILSFTSSILTIRGLGEEETEEKENLGRVILRNHAIDYTIIFFALGVLGVTYDAVFG